MPARLPIRTCALLLLAACGDPKPDLPEGWEEAESIVEFSQSPCDGDPATEPADQAINVSVSGGSADVTWAKIVFRCSQTVEGFVRRGEGTIDMLVQPEDLEPEEVARCDCQYNLDASFNVADSERTFSFFTRPDQVGGPSSPSLVGSVTIE